MAVTKTVEAARVNEAIGALRIKIGHEKGEAGGYFVKEWKPCWVVDFPMFEYDEEGKRWNACHHPFTSPKAERCSCFSTRTSPLRSGRVGSMKDRIGPGVSVPRM